MLVRGTRSGQALEENKEAIGWGGVTKIGDAGSLKICLGSGDSGFVEDGRCWAGMIMELLDWEILVKDNL